ncbi:hypothetical protein JXQ31_04275 [candidate division KSB1 bacterium]|nr:hypothetical protein [candidate division KSB1 bacterium]
MTNSLRARSKAMGGAFFAVSDGLSSAFYNPASLDLFRYPRSTKFAFFLNPVAPASLINDAGDLSVEKKYDSVDWINVAGLLTKGFALSRPAFSAVLLLSEELPRQEVPDKVEKNNVISSKGILDWNYDILAVKLRLAEQISIGASGFLFTSIHNDSLKRQYGSSYGINIQPNSYISVGVAYFDIPSNVADLMFLQNRIIDETINVGILIKPFRFLSFSLDSYNVSEDNAKITREIHVGTEFVPAGFTAFRAGFYREQDTEIDVYSVGLGLIDNNSFHSTDDSFSSHNFAFNYGLQVKKVENNLYYQHYLTFLLRF